MDPLTIARLWIAVRPFKRWKEHRLAKRAAENQATENVPAEAAPVTSSAPTLEEIETMNAMKGAMKSRLVWLGLAQIAYGVFNMWATGQAITPESVGPVISGAATVILRALTTGSLAEKGA
jgi:hypothetical protein